MNLHKHARLTPRGRAPWVQRIHQGLRVEAAAQAVGVGVRTQGWRSLRTVSRSSAFFITSQAVTLAVLCNRCLQRWWGGCHVFFKRFSPY